MTVRSLVGLAGLLLIGVPSGLGAVLTVMSAYGRYGWQALASLCPLAVIFLWVAGDIAWKATEEWRFHRAGRRMKK